jgi:hypothetical protein
MVNLEQFRENAREEKICDRYAEKWDNAGSKKVLMDLALSVQGADFLCDGIGKGWGISSVEIVRRFGHYINGRYVYECEGGYSSVMYCGYEGSIDVDTSLVVLIDSDVVLVVPEFCVVDIYATGKVSMSIVGGGRVRLIAYGDAGNVVVESVDGGCRFRRIQKNHWSRGEN